MTCAQALEFLLDADPADLAGQGASPLATHVRECARCQRLAGQVLNDTHLLAAAASMSATRPQPVERRTWALAFMAPATVAVALMVMTQLRERSPDIREPVVSLAPVTADVPVIQSQPVPAEPAVAPRPVATRLGKAFPAPVPLVPVRVEQRDRVVVDAPTGAAQTVAVAPPAGMRAAVLQTSDPKLVVVWLY